MNPEQDPRTGNALANPNQLQLQQGALMGTESMYQHGLFPQFQGYGQSPGTRGQVNWIHFSGPTTNHVNVYHASDDSYERERNLMALQNGQQNGAATTPARKPRAPRKKPAPKVQIQEPQVAGPSSRATSGAEGNSDVGGGGVNLDKSGGGSPPNQSDSD